METVVKEKKVFISKNKPEIELPPTKMTEAEFDAKIQRAREQYARGEFTRLERKDFKKFLGLD